MVLELTTTSGALIGGGLALAFAVAATLRRQPASPDRDDPPPVFGDASFATLKDALAHDVKADATCGPWIGIWNEAHRKAQHSYRLAYAGKTSALLLGATGSGKLAASFAFTLLLCRKQIIIYDPAGQAARISKRRRRELGQRVVVIDPFEQIDDEPSASINPLGLLHSRRQAAVLVGNQAATLISHNPDSNNAFFSLSARGLGHALALHLLETKGPFASWPGVYQVLILPGRRRNAVFGCMRDSKYAMVRNYGERFYIPPKIDKETGEELPGGSLPREAESILVTAQTDLQIFGMPEFERLFATTTFDFAEMQHTPTTVYLVFSDAAAKNYAAALQLLVTTAKDALLTPWWGKDRPLTPRVPVLMIIDEVCTSTNSLIVETLHDIGNVGRKYKVQMQLGAQNLAQLGAWCKRGGHELNDLISACGLLQLFGANDPVTAAYADQAGQRTIWQPSSDPLAGLIPGSGGLSPMGVPLLRPETMRDMLGNGQQLVFLRGSSKPLLLSRWPNYYEVPDVAALADIDPFEQG